MQNRIIKTEEELSNIIKSASITDKVFDLVLENIKIGMTEVEVANFIEQSFLRLGGEKLSFDTIVAFGENGAEPHHVPCDRRLSGAEFVTIDMGTVVGGYCSDFTRTFAVGGATREMLDVYEAVREAEKIGADALKEPCKEGKPHAQNDGYGECEKRPSERIQKRTPKRSLSQRLEERGGGLRKGGQDVVVGDDAEGDDPDEPDRNERRDGK